MDKYDEMFDELDREFDPYAEDEDTLDKIFEELDDFGRETEALYGVPIRSTKGDVRNLRRVQTGEYWKSAEQIVYPVNNEKVQEYLKNKDDKPFVFPKIAVLAFAGLLVVFGVVHGISNLFRTAAEEASKNYANVLTVDKDDTSPNKDNGTVDEAKKTELQVGTTYLTEDKQFEFTFDDGKYSGVEGITITEYLGDATEVTLPKEIQGYPVIDVQRSTLEGNNSIEKVIIESEIKTMSFRDCAALKEVIFPATVNELGGSTFYNTPMMESVTVDKGCYVDKDFGGYDSSPAINYVEMTEGVGDNTQVSMENGHNYYTADGQFQFQFENDTMKLRKYIGDGTEATVPKEIQGYPVTAILRSTFEGNNTIEKVIIEAEIASGGDIFRDCEALKEVIFPVTIEKLGYTTFYNTPSLETVTVHKGCEVHDGFGGYNASPTVNYID